MAGQPLSPATHRCLGGPLPHQLANGTQAPSQAAALKARHLCSPDPETQGCYPVLARLSPGYSKLESRLPTRYSPVRHFTGSLAAPFSCDLHVLGTPPAFILSQDQTLQLNDCAAGYPTTQNRRLIPFIAEREGFSKDYSPLNQKRRARTTRFSKSGDSSPPAGVPVSRQRRATTAPSAGRIRSSARTRLEILAKSSWPVKALATPLPRCRCSLGLKPKEQL